MKFKHSEASTLSASLRPINPNMMKPVEEATDKKRLWYQGKEPYFDVIVEMLDDEVTWFQMTLRGKVVSWNPPNFVVTGETDELDVPPEVAYYAASKTIRDGGLVDWDFVRFTQQIMAQRTEDPVLQKVSDRLKAALKAT